MPEVSSITDSREPKPTGGPATFLPAVRIAALARTPTASPQPLTTAVRRPRIEHVTFIRAPAPRTSRLLAPRLIHVALNVPRSLRGLGHRCTMMASRMEGMEARMGRMEKMMEKMMQA